MPSETAPPGDGPVSAATPPVPAAASRRPGFAGYSWPQLVTGAALLGVAVWGAWATREIMGLRERKIVAVSLAAMANDFVMAEARSGNSLEQTSADTQHYLGVLQTVLQERAARGETILVGEAVVSASAPDITPEVREAVGKRILANPAPRLSAAAPAIPPGAPSAGASPAARNSSGNPGGAAAHDALILPAQTGGANGIGAE